MAGLGVPPDVTLLSSGADPAAEVGRPTAPFLWVGEKRRAVGWVEVWASTQATC